MNSQRLILLLLFISFTLRREALAKQRSSPFSIALETLQNQINYKFNNVGLLQRAMTHASYSEENNKALSMLGESVIRTSVAHWLLINNVDILAKDLNVRLAEVSKVEECAGDGTLLGLQKIVRASHKTNVTAPSVVCGAFRAVFGAIALDADSLDSVRKVYGALYGGTGRAVAI